jgi:ribosomal protein L40E
MFPNNCPFCEHGNPADAKFCSACGGALHLVPCPRCGAVSDVIATTCYQCHGQLPGRGTDALDPASPATEVSRPLPRRQSRVFVGTTILAAIVGLGYYSYRHRSLVEAAEPQAASGVASIRSALVGAGVIRRDAVAGDSVPTSAATSPPGIQLAVPTRETETPPRAVRRPVESRNATVAVAPIARPQATDAGKARRLELPRPVECTESVAALGLCPPDSFQRKVAETAFSTRAFARPQANAASKAGVQAPPRQEACTEAVAALGLCTP